MTKEQNNSKVNPNDELKWIKCCNKMLESIRSKKNLWENMDDFSDFEKTFNWWDYNLIILDELKFVNDMENPEDNYSFMETLGIYNNIWMFARKLQWLLPHHTDWKTISVLFNWDTLNMDICKYWDGEVTIHNHYVARFGKLNQIEWHFGWEWYKF